MEDEKWLALQSFTKKVPHEGPQTSAEGEQEK